MCGRYWVDWDMINDIETLVGEIDQSMKSQKEVWPGEKAAVITLEENTLKVSGKLWGFPGFDSGKLIFNARSETVTDKKMFSDSILHRRCIIPAAGYYEWNKKKEKFAFRDTAAGCIYLAGFYKKYGKDDRFVILTTQAGNQAAAIHDRQPVILGQKEIADFLSEENRLRSFLDKPAVALSCSTDYEQQTLW